MSEIFGSIWWYLVTIGVLVTFHEFGHFWVARRCGVKVLKFSIGFGKSLWSRTGKDGTVYSIGAIPLGGFVSMLDERVEDVPPELRHMAHNNKSNAQKIAIAAAGPGFNFLLAVLAFWLMFAIGKPDNLPIFGRAEGLAAEAGMTAGSRVLAVNGKSLDTYSEVMAEIGEAAAYRRDVLLRVREPDGDERDLDLRLSALPREIDDKLIPSRVGLHIQAPAAVSSLSVGAPAELAGLKLGDTLLALNGHPVADFDQFAEMVQREAALNPRILVEISRAGTRMEIPVTARLTTLEDGSKRYLMGIGQGPLAPNTERHYGPLAAIPAALQETWTTTAKTVAFIRDMVTGLISTKNLSGPFTIARTANAVAQEGLAWFLWFLGAVSVGIAILNLLPIPILDGGHILSYLIESLKGSPLSERTMMVGQYLGLGMLACLIGLAVFNDLVR